MSDLRFDAQFVVQQLTRLLADYPDLLDDEDLARDMAEGETDIKSVASRALTRRIEAETMATAIRDRERTLAARRQRLERQAEAMSDLIRRLLDAGKLSKLELPEATVSARDGLDSVDVTDLDALPQGYFRTVRQADKAAIVKSIKAGETIPGATLTPGKPGITVRRT